VAIIREVCGRDGSEAEIAEVIAEGGKYASGYEWKPAMQRLAVARLARGTARVTLPRLLASPGVGPPATQTITGSKWSTFADVVRMLSTRGERMPTGFETFDRATRGGPFAGRVIVIGGAPGSGKTSLVVQLARHYFLAGHAIAIVASDEEASGLAIRWGQAAGFVREDLETGEEETLRALHREVNSERCALLVDQDVADAPLEAIVSKLVPLAQTTGRPGVLVVDSVQTVRTLLGDAADSPRERINCAVSAIKRAAKVDGLLVLVTSEMARGFYRGGSDASTSGLASFKESGSIEYGASVALSMRNVTGESCLFDVQIEKNRLGEKLAFRLEMDRDRATFAEVAGPEVTGADEDRAVAKAAARERRIAEIAEQMLQALAQSSVTVSNQHVLRALVKGEEALKAAAVSQLLAHGRIVGGNGKPFLVPSDCQGVAA
jgi:KaiC/GvpD/RAD55 family RecA-like ATPase